MSLLGNAIRRGLASARGASGVAAKAGQLFFATDTKTLAHDDGAAWADIANLTTFGTTAGTAAEGNDGRLSDPRTPTGGAGGVLSGTYPNPGFAADMATQAELDAVAAAKANTSHTHAAGDITSGTIATARLGSGTADNTKFLRGDQTWADPAAGGLTNPMTTPGDLIVGGTSGTPARLAKGADGQVLTVDPTTHLLVWATPSGGGGGGLADPTTTIGDIIYKDGVPDSINFAASANGATATATAARGGGAAGGLIDGSDASWWSYAAIGVPSPQSNRIALNTARTISKIVVTGGDAPGGAYAPASYTIEVSTDGATWTTVVPDYTPIVQTTTHTFAEVVGVTHIRLTVLADTPGWDGSYVRELRAYKAASVSLVRLPIGTAGQRLEVVNVGGNLIPQWVT